MMSRDFRESLAEQLRDTTFRNDLAQVMFEQDGLDSLRMWLQEVARADAFNEAQGHVTPGRVFDDYATDFAGIRAVFDKAGLDFAEETLRH